MKKYILIILLLNILGYCQLYSQVTIGTTNKPADYSVLELDASEKKGGFLLPRLDAVDCQKLKDYLNAGPQFDACGLVIFNTTEKKMQFWTGNDWANINQEHHLIAENGLTVLDDLKGGIKLGGELVDGLTTVSIGVDNILSFSASNESLPASKFIVTFEGNETTNPSLIVNDKKIGIGTNNPQAQLDIKTNEDDEKPALRISGSQENSSYLLASDFYGNALWQPFKPVSSIIEGKLSEGKTPPTTFGATMPINPQYSVNITTKPLKLPPGKWLIVAKYSSYVLNEHCVAGLGCSKDYYHYISLCRKTGTNSYVEHTMMASLPEQKFTYTDGQNRAYTSPQLFYYYENESAEEQEFHIFAKTSKQGYLSDKFGGAFFQALRIDGLLSSAISISGNVTCNLSGNIFTMKTGDAIDHTFPSSQYVRIDLSTGVLHLETGDIIGSTNGIDVKVVNGPYDISSGGLPQNVQIKLEGKLDSGIASGPFGIPLKIPNATFTPNCDVATINVLTRGVIDASRYDNVFYSGKNRNINTVKELSLTLSSGSITIDPGDELGSSNGIKARYAGSNTMTYYSIGSYIDLIPVRFSGTVDGGAPEKFIVPVSLTNTLTGEVVGPCDGLEVHVVEGSLNCGTGIKVPSNAKISAAGKIHLTLSPTSSSYRLNSNTTLGSGSGITVRYAGSPQTLTAGSTYELDVIYICNTVLPVNIYTISLNNLYNSGVNITACSTTVTVEDYGYFNCSTLNPYTTVTIPSMPAATSITAPLGLTVNNGTVELRAGDILGEYTLSGNRKYTVTVVDPITLSGTSGSPASDNVTVQISGPAITSPTTFSIPLDKVSGVAKCNVNMSFVNP